MHDISAEAGISVGLIYRYFENKEAVISAMADRHKQEIGEVLERARQAPTLLESLEILFTAHCCEDAPQLVSAFVVDLYAEASRNPRVADLVRDVLQTAMDGVTELIARAPETQNATHGLTPSELAEILILVQHGREPTVIHAMFNHNFRRVLELLNAQPIRVECNKGAIALAHNGNLVNAHTLRRQLEQNGSIFQITSDTEVVVHLIAQSKEQTLPDAIADALRRIEGAFSLVLMTRESPLLCGVPEGAMVYFVHSYVCQPEDPAAVVATADHGGPFCAVLQRGHVFATQFHPEKSGEVGLRMLDNFARLGSDGV